MFMWCQCRAVQTRSLRRPWISWVGDISKNWLSIRCLTCAFSNDAFNGLRKVSLELWTPFEWRSSMWTGWRRQRVRSNDWMASRPTLKKAIIGGRLVLPKLVDVVANIVWVWPLIVLYLRERYSSATISFFWNLLPLFRTHVNVLLMYRRRGWMGISI